jgi:hypothetical protein
MKNIKNFEKFNEDNKIIDHELAMNTHSVNKHISSINKEREKDHDLHLSNMEKYGSITLSNGYNYIFSDFKFKNSSYKGNKIIKFDLSLVPEQDILSYEEGGGYYSTSFAGLVIKFDLNGRLISVDEDLDDKSVEKVSRYIKDNYSFKIEVGN